MPNYWPNCSSVRCMSWGSPKPWDMKHGVTHYFRFTVDMLFVLDFLTRLVRIWLKKFICIHKRVNSIVFAVSIKLCDESGLPILIVPSQHLPHPHPTPLCFYSSLQIPFETHSHGTTTNTAASTLVYMYINCCFIFFFIFFYYYYYSFIFAIITVSCNIKFECDPKW